MTRLLITTVGTSLLTNRDDRSWQWSRDSEDLPDADTVDTWLATADLTKASAEMNTLHRRAIGATDRISFLHSDTPEGKYCSERLGTYYIDKCREVKQCVLSDLNYKDKNAQNGLKSLIVVTLAEYRRARELGLTPIFCATGGFKAEIAFLNLLGALLNIEVYYIHELHREEVLLPRLPLRWNAEYVNDHQDFFRWIQGDMRDSREAESWLNAHPELQTLVEDVEIEGVVYTALNAAGLLLFEAAEEYRSPPVWPPNSKNSPEEKNGLSKVRHHRLSGWENFVRKLCVLACVNRVSYTAAYGGDAVKIMDAAAGVIGVRFGPIGKELPLKVETTARGEEQTKLVVGHIRSLLT